MHKFEKGKVYRTLNGKASLVDGNERRLIFSHYGKEDYPLVSHEHDGRCSGVDDKWRDFDILGPLNERPAITVEYREAAGETPRGWFVRQGDRSADALGIDEMLCLFVALTFKSPLPCLQWLKTDEERAADQKRSEERKVEREKEREATAQQQQQDAAALDELRSFVGQYSSFDTLQQIVDWVKANYKVDQFDLITPLHNQIHECCDSAGIPRHVELGGKRHSVLRPQQRLALLYEAAVDGKKARQKLERLTGFIQGMGENTFR